MAVSGTNTFSQTRNQIINRAFAILGVKTQARTPTASEVSSASDVLNMMVKSWKSKGQYLWKTSEGTLFLVYGQAQYILDGSTANATESFNQTTTSAAASSGASSVDVASTTGFTVGYNIGVAQDDNTILWTTIASIASSTITLNTSLTSDVASGSKVYVYESKINRPERVNSCRLRYDDDVTDVPMNQVSRNTYFNYSNKFAKGKPNSYFYDKQLSSGNIYLYPTPDDATDTIKFTFEKQFFDFSSAIDDPDFPVEWLLPISTNLAYLLSYEYGIGAEKAERIKRDADQLLEDAQGYDREDTSIYFEPQIAIYENY
jgi:hypothetical protein